jgi:gamma-butyrobetaine dioxygenase
MDTTSLRAVDIIGELFASEGAADYPGEPVTQAAHMLQAAALAERSGAPSALVAAALLHDVGHLTGVRSGAVEPDYLARLSPASVFTLGLQERPPS